VRRRSRREALYEPLNDLLNSAHPVVEELPVQRDLLSLLDALPPAQRRAIALTKNRRPVDDRGLRAIRCFGCRR
jgi:DNA-directed RNA polymerase specialized sigma24 family protein